MTAAKPWRIRPWDPASEADEAGVRALNARCGEPPLLSTHEFFDWYYRRNPAGFAAMQLACAPAEGSEAERIVGTYVTIPLEGALRGRTVPLMVAVNVLIEKECRGIGIFNAIARATYQQAADRGFPVVFAYPNPNSHPLYLKFHKFVELGRTPLLIRVLRLSRTVRRKFPVEGLRAPLSIVSVPGNFLFRPSAAQADPSVAAVERFDKDFDVLNGALMQRFPVMIQRKAPFLNWRYVEGPRPYGKLAVRDRGGIAGYITWSVMDFAGMRCAMLTDFVLRGEDAGCAAAGARLLRAGLRAIYEQDCDIVGGLSLPGPLEHRLLKRALFIECPDKLLPQPFPFIFRKHVPEAEGESEIFQIKNWFTRIGDYDAA